VNRLGVVIYGASGHALVVADALGAAGGWKIAGFLDDLHPERQGSIFGTGASGGAAVLGGGSVLHKLRARGIKYGIVGVGDNRVRVRLAQTLREHGFRLATVIHPRATVASGVSIGCGTLIAAGAVVGPGARIGENVVVNTAASVDHECVVEDGGHIGPGARLGGRVTVGAVSWIGIGATVRDRVQIGAGSVIGAGALVLDDIPAGVVATGAPARVVRDLEAASSEC